MPYSIYYPSGCDAEIPDHQCSNCDDIEHGRVRSIAYIHNDFTFTDPTNPLQWQAGILEKKIIIIPDVNVTFDGGAETTGDGYGDQQTKLLGYNFTLEYKDPSYKNNANFYNEIKKSRNFYIAYRTETQVHFSDVTVQVIPTNPVTANTTDEVVWDVKVQWSNGDVPTPYDAPAGTFVCFDYN
jgi:hypothetical protein